MNYTQETLLVKKPSARLLKALEAIRENKRQQLQKLRDMKPDDFDVRVSIRAGISQQAILKAV